MTVRSSTTPFDVSATPEQGQRFRDRVSFDDVRRAAKKHEADLGKKWEAFEQSERGEVQASFFGESFETAVALTVARGRQRFLRRARDSARLHVHLDLASAGQAAEIVSRYERVRVKAGQLLVGAEQEYVMRLVYDRLCQLIRVIDEERFRKPPAHVMTPVRRDDREEPGDVQRARLEAQRDHEARIKRALQVAREEVGQAEELCDRAVRRVALMAYFVGMLGGVVVFTMLGILLGQLLADVEITGFELTDFLTAFIAGAVGAVVSVMSRMASGRADVEYETTRAYLSLLGAFRPLIGAIFGVALYFGIASGVLQFIQPPQDPDEVFFFYAFIAFLAGFSERWAQDMLVMNSSKASPEAGPAAR